MVDYSRIIELLNKETGKGNLGRQESVERLKMYLEKQQESYEEYFTKDGD